MKSKKSNARLALESKYEAARRRSQTCATRRANLPPGSSRAKVTSANAAWATAAEERDRIERELTELREREAES